MTQGGAVWLVIFVALAAANAPFANQRWLLVGPLARPHKPLAGRLAEMLLFYCLTGALGFGLEWRQGQIAPQGWEFFAITATLFVTMGFPGLVCRYLLRRPQAGRKDPAASSASPP